MESEKRVFLGKILPHAKSNQIMGPVAVSEGCGAELSEDGGGVGGGGWSGEGGALDLRHVGHHVVGRRAHHRDTLVPVLHLVVDMKSHAQHGNRIEGK